MVNELADKDFRNAVLEENVKTGVAYQVRALREKMKWSQAELGEKAGKTQSVVCRIEDPSYGKFTIRTLLDFAEAFDVALLVKFVSYSRFATELENLSPSALAVPSYSEEAAAIERSFDDVGSALASAVSPRDANRESIGIAGKSIQPSHFQRTYQYGDGDDFGFPISGNRPHSSALSSWSRGVGATQ